MCASRLRTRSSPPTARRSSGAESAPISIAETKLRSRAPGYPMVRCPRARFGVISMTSSATTMRTMAALAALCLLPTAARAQDTLRDAVKLLMTNQGVPTGDVARDCEAAEASHDVVARALLLNLTSAPLGTSSGGFLYRLNPELGTVERVSQNFGTFLVDRAVMGGAGSMSFGITDSTVGYDRLNGYDLRDGGFVTVANRFRDEAAAVRYGVADAPSSDRAPCWQSRASAWTMTSSSGLSSRSRV